MKKTAIIFCSALAALALGSCNNDENKTADVFNPKEENVSYQSGDQTMNSFVVYDAGKEGKRPGVVVIPEWWGLNDYVRGRARQLAELGYIAIAMDMYGNGKTADNPDSAGALAGAFYADPSLAQARFQAALAELKSNPQTDSSRIAAIGYCFGGAQVLNMARLGEDLKGVVSFHGNLVGVPADKQVLKADILICHGGSDPFVPEAEVNQFKKQMDSIGASYTFREYPGATHAFTNPEATEKGNKFSMPIKYDPAADSASWKDMRVFLDKVLK